MPCTKAQPAPFAMSSTNVFLHFKSILERCLPKRFRVKIPYVCLEKCSFYNRETKLTRMQNNSGTHAWSSVIECRCHFSSFSWKQGAAEKCSGGGGGRVILMTTPLHRNEYFI